MADTAAQPAIRIDGLWKQYVLGARDRGYRTLREAIVSGLTAPLRRLQSLRGDSAGDPRFWALEDLSFEVNPGEVVGIIGRNGAGKSTLLKILSRITEPTRGQVKLRGRVGSLLEVGTGFHSELTGRENIYLNGAILGMRRAEIGRVFNDIVAFAEIADFLDTPIKRYSSGMHVRLAFAVAAYLEAEILLLDEVLAVGDIGFQKRCFGKMEDVAKGGRTILFVSHQLNQIRRLCTQAICIDAGRIRFQGSTSDVIEDYEKMVLGSTQLARERSGTFVSWEIPGHGNVVHDAAGPVELRVAIELKTALTNGHFGMVISDAFDRIVVGWAKDGISIPAGLHAFFIRLPCLPLKPGIYVLGLSLFNQGNNLTGGESVDTWRAVPHLVVDAEPLTHPQEHYAGILNIPAEICIS